MAKAVTVPGHAANEAYARKIREAGEECRRQGIVFTPLALETLGGWHEVAEAELRKLGAALARQTGQSSLPKTFCPVSEREQCNDQQQTALHGCPIN